jgi:two-component system sensor histidine kinase DesK
VIAILAAVGSLVAAGAGPPAVSVMDGVHAAVVTAVVALVLFGMGWFARLAAGQQAVQQQLVARAIADERLRFSRDTHDLLGLSLSAITLKGELIGRLVGEDSLQAKRELAELVAMSRKTLADVRAVAAGHRELSFEEECRAVAAVLRAADIRVTFHNDIPDPLPPEVATTFATVLREAMTNVVRHSRATWCRVSVRVSGGTAWLSVANDGVREPESGLPCGSGLGNLQYRVGELGGELSAEVCPDGMYRLCATVPVRLLASRSG